MQEFKNKQLKSVCLVVLNNFKNDSRVLKEAISLKKNGYEVIVLAMFDKGQGIDEVKDDIQIKRIPLKTRSLPKIKPIQFLKYFEFLIKAYLVAKKHNIIHCNDLNSLPVGVFCKIFNNRKVVYDAHEYEINHIPNESNISIRLKYYFENILIKYADKVITVSESIANEYVKLYKIEKPTLIFNTPNYQIVNKSNKFKEIFNLSNNQKIFIYQGAMSKGRGIELILKTFQDILLDFKNSKNKFPPVVIFMGYGPLEENIKNITKTHENIFFQPAVPPDVLVHYTSSSDFGISLIEDICLSYRYCLPNKLFEYIMSEIPVVVSDLFEMKRFVNENNLGVVLKNNTPKDFKKLIYNLMKTNSNDFKSNIYKVKSLYNWEEQEKVFLNLYKKLN